MSPFSYAQKYTADKNARLYPVEFVIRAFLGTYPELTSSRASYHGKRILDLGYGDGRNMILLKELGFKIHGVETSEVINRHVRKRLFRLGIKADLKVGSNQHIPYEDRYFDYVLACHSCYYVDKGDTFNRNLAEIARVMKSDGVWVASLPMPDTYILKGAKKLPGGHFEIKKDPYGLRNGTVFRAFASVKEIKSTLRPFFSDIKLGFCDENYWGIRQKLWILVCRRNKK